MCAARTAQKRGWHQESLPARISVRCQEEELLIDCSGSGVGCMMSAPVNLRTHGRYRW